MSENNNTNIDKKIQDAYAQAEQVALIAVLKLIYETTKIDLYKDFKLEYPLSSNKSVDIKCGELILTNSNNKHCKVFLDIINKDYDFMSTYCNAEINFPKVETFSEINEVTKKQIIGMLSYLTQSCLSIFNNLKSKYKELIEYNIVLDDNTTIYLDVNNPKRIGIIFQNFIKQQ